MTYTYEDTAFVIDETAEHEECPECKGGTLPPPQMTTTYSRVLTSNGGYEDKPIFDLHPIPDHIAHLPHGHSCGNKDCYFGKILTPYEQTMQKIVYAMSSELHGAKREARDLHATVEKFETSTLSGRLAAAAAGNLPRFTVINLPGHEPIVRRSQD